MGSLWRFFILSAAALLAAASSIAATIPSFPNQGFVQVNGDFPQVFTLDCTGDPCATGTVSHVVDLTAFDNKSGTASLDFNQAFFRAYVSDEGTGGAAGTAIGTIQQNITIPTAGSFLELAFHLTGAVSTSLSIPTQIVQCVAENNCGTGNKALPAATVQFSMGCVDFALSGLGPGQDCTQTLTFNTSQNVDTTITLLIPYIPGQPFGLKLMPEAQATLAGMFAFASDGTAVTATGQAIGDFSHSLVTLPAVVLDSNMNPVANPIITSDSGFDYLNPPGESSTAPEPSALLPCAFVGLLAWRGLRR